MSRSYRTRPKNIIAQERMPRDKEGQIIFPRIIVRKPKPGDIHPMSQKMIARAYDKLPIEYFYGLKEIELRARPGEIGKPFGKYSRYAKKIILFSVPEKQWDITNPSQGLIDALNRYNAKIIKTENGIIVEWEDDFLLFMFYLSILFHELGHNYVNQYKNKRKPPLDVNLNEFFADAQVVKLQKYVFGRRID
jgi:hypothetical protein